MKINLYTNSSLRKFVMILCTGLIIQSLACLNAQTSTDLWNAYTANPDNHPNIPNCSYAGYRTGNAPLPNPSGPIYNVKNAPYNAVGNGTTDDAPAIQAAIDAAGVAGGGVVFVPVGTYLLNNFLHIKYSNVVLRGAGRDLTTLDFAKSLQTIKGDLITNGADYNWWWSGGLIWIGPGDTFDGNGNVVIPNSYIQAWEYWRGGSVITTVSGTPTRGAKAITVANASGLAAGMKVLMVWDNPSDKSLIKHVYGHGATEGGLDTGAGGVGDCSGIISPTYSKFQWAVEIASVSGNVVTLVQPLRLDVRANWNVRFEQTGNMISESGIENLRIKGHAQMGHTHLTKPTNLVGGWNGVYINRSWNCWTNNIAVTSMEEGVVLAAAKNVTVNNVLIDGPEQNHHSFACRVNSHDNLFQDYAVNGPQRVRHGINTEWLSSGNVWSRGVQKVGTFDSHRALSFDIIRTECTVANDQGSVPGGGGGAGPYIGRRAVLWNVLEYIDPNYTYANSGSRNGDDIHEPKQYVMGAMVGVRGKSMDVSEGESMPLGDKGTIVADDGIVPSILNLYEVEKSLRANPEGITPPTVSIASPLDGATFASGSNITINANASDADGTIAKVEFYSGTTKLGEDLSSPYSFVWTNVTGGTYSLVAKAIDNSTMVTTSAAIGITVGNPSSYRNPENPDNTVNGLNYSYYEGSWTSLPDFSTLTPVKTGNTYNFYTSLKNRDNQFALKFTGYINIPADGEYTFYTTSADGSKLYIGTTLVVNNDGQHNQQERSGTIGLKAGKHALTVTFFDQNAGEMLSVSYSGSNLTKTTIPATAMYRVSTNPSEDNLAFNRPVTVSNTEKPQYPGSNAVDGNPESRWSTLFSDPQWIYVDLGAEYNISRVKLTWEVFGKDFKIQVTNNTSSTWTDIKTVTGNTAQFNDFTGLSGSGRYIRMYGTARGTSYGYSLYEFEVYGTSTSSTNVAPSVAITSPANNASFAAGSTITLTATATDSDGTITKVEFYQGSNKLGEDTSSPYSFDWTNVAANNYNLTAKATDDDGAATTSATIAITVNAAPVLVTDVSVSPTSATLDIAATQQLTPTVSPANATNKAVSWSTSNASVATVSSSGLVTAVAAGNATITVTTTDQNKTATCAVVVNPASGAGDGLKADYFNSRDLSGSVAVSRIDQTVNFDWGNGTYATSQNTDNFSARWTGQVKPQYTETYTFETETDDGVRLWVNGTLLVDKWVDQSPTKWSGTISLTANQKYDIKMEYFENGGGAVARLRWSSASQAYSIIPQAQLYSTSTPVSVTSVSVSPTSASITVGGSQQLTATVNPANATNKTVSWTTSNASVATVNASGLVSAIAEGAATITATTQDGSFTSTCAITVNAPVAGDVVYAINAGGAAFTATDGTVYEADRYFTGGSTYTTGTSTIANTTDDDLYRSERYGNISYELPVTNGNYTVTLKFAEIYMNGTGKRQFDVAIEGVQSISNLDIFAVAGANYTAYDVTKEVTVSDGKLNIVFTTDIDNAKISAILVKSSSQLKNQSIANNVEKAAQIGLISVYPNPATSTLTIESSIEGETQVSLYNASGKAVSNALYKGKFKATIDISSLPSGVYVVKAVSGERVEEKKIVLSK